MNMQAHIRRSEDSFQEFFLSFHSALEAGSLVLVSAAGQQEQLLADSPFSSHPWGAELTKPPHLTFSVSSGDQRQETQVTMLATEPSFWTPCGIFTCSLTVSNASGLKNKTTMYLGMRETLMPKKQ